MYTCRYIRCICIYVYVQFIGMYISLVAGLSDCAIDKRWINEMFRVGVYCIAGGKAQTEEQQQERVVLAG